MTQTRGLLRVSCLALSLVLGACQATEEQPPSAPPAVAPATAATENTGDGQGEPAAAPEAALDLGECTKLMPRRLSEGGKEWIQKCCAAGAIIDLHNATTNALADGSHFRGDMHFCPAPLELAGKFTYPDGHSVTGVQRAGTWVGAVVWKGADGREYRGPADQMPGAGAPP
jgi:hypothetical protein